MSGHFITIEGGEGSGKTTQIRLLMDAFSHTSIATFSTREPGGTESAEILRNLLLQGDENKWDAISETLLFYAARREHMVHVVWPAMKEGTTVICDRFHDSTRAYQGFAKCLGDDFVMQLHRLVIGNFLPDLTLWLDINAEKGLERAISRPDEKELRFESIQDGFHDRVRLGFETLAENESKRIVRINANHSITKVHEAIIHALNHHLDLQLIPQQEAKI
ncbi:MAG: dTMP kinase [Alphaproteobacteria bacterium]|nr:dTMP kinase [Alphaproteobacteria bacterium]